MGNKWWCIFTNDKTFDDQISNLNSKEHEILFKDPKQGKYYRILV